MSSLRGSVNGTYGQLTLCDDFGRLNLTPGTWTVEVNAGKTTGAYTFNLLAVPPDEHFSISIGDTVSPGHPAAGAGHISAHGARQLYEFKGTPGQLVDSSAIRATSGRSRPTVPVSSCRNSIASRFSLPPLALGRHVPLARE